MRWASCARASNSCGLRRPRSAKTLPLPSCAWAAFLVVFTVVVLLPLGRAPFHMVLLRHFESLPDAFDVRPGCLDALLGFLLEGIQDVNRTGELHGVHPAER